MKTNIEPHEKIVAFENKEDKLEKTYSEMQSPSLGKLITALAKAQSTMKGAIKDSKNPFFKHNYADLTSILDACRKPLSENGLAVIQTTEPSVNPNINEVVVVTMLAHSSGEWIKGKLAMRPLKNDPQAIGSVITYARRYALAAITGIPQKDDDAECAMVRNGKNHVELLNEASKKGQEAFNKVWHEIPLPQKNTFDKNNYSEWKNNIKLADSVLTQPH